MNREGDGLFTQALADETQALLITVATREATVITVQRREPKLKVGFWCQNRGLITHRKRFTTCIIKFNASFPSCENSMRQQENEIIMGTGRVRTG